MHYNEIIFKQWYDKNIYKMEILTGFKFSFADYKDSTFNSVSDI